MPGCVVPTYGLAAIASYFDSASVPAAFASSSPAARVAGELAAFACPAHQHGHATSPRTPMLSMNPAVMERVAVITDVQQLQFSEWWLARRRCTAREGPRPFPLCSVHFCVGAALEHSVDVLARVPACAATVVTLNLNSRCDTHNSIPSLDSLARLVHLRELLMKNTTVTPPGPPLRLVVTQELHAVFRQLRRLVVGDFYLVQHLPLHDLLALEEVDLGGTGVTNGVVQALASCRRIHTLTLSGCVGVSCFAPLAGLAQLTRLDVSHTRLDDAGLHRLCHGCPQLSALVLSSCGIISNFAPVEQLRELRCLHVSRTRLRNSDLERICGLTELEELCMSACRILNVFTPLASLEALHTLDVHDTWMNDAGVEAIAQCAALQKLNVSHCRGVQSFAPLARLERLAELNASCTLVTDACLTALCTASAASRLRVLLLNCCRRITTFAVLRHVAALEELGACDTSFDDAALEAVAQCPLLARVHLHVCTGLTSLTPLVTCARLHHVGIGGTRFSCNASSHECAALVGRGVQLSHRLFLVTAF
ncbi:Leucine Rich repeat [Novymonas esmeraldas]|uniref:Leucine Rich repeat n=1 Tax=Novymonas esmeraldas TaxID=1808958 RepID=A0AAW0EZM4_9TRYP